jgi:thiol:disulfide interchange protein DsbC
MRISLILAFLALSSIAFASDSPESKAKHVVPSTVKNTVSKIFGESASEKIRRSPVAGLYEVVVGNGDILYISRDGRHIIMGNIFTKKGRNLTKKRQNQLLKELNPQRQKLINAVDESEMVVFAPEGETKYTVNVFTDVDCHYCAEFHKERHKLKNGGVKVRYLAFPRAGMGSGTAEKMTSVWCASNQQKAMTKAKNGSTMTWVKCSADSRKNSKQIIEAQLKLGQQLGVSGTPAMILQDGELMPGYLPAKKLIPYLESKFGK